MYSYEFQVKCNPSRLMTEIVEMGILNTIIRIDCWENPDTLIIWFDTRLSNDDSIKLSNIIAEHNKLGASATLIAVKDAEQDTDGTQFVRLKAAKSGWGYTAIPIEFKTSRLNSLYSKDKNGSNRAGISLKFYNNSDVEVTTPGLADINETTIVKTVVEFEPPFDYELIGGNLKMFEFLDSTLDCRVWIMGGDTVEIAGGLNLKYINNASIIEVDGRVTKFLPYNVVTHTNKISFIFKHNAGMKKDIQITLELYKA